MYQRISVERSGALISPRAKLAIDPWSRMKGLLGRRDLPGGEGIILRPSSSIHMMFMAFAIDVVYTDRDDRVIKIVRDLKPWRLSAARGAHSTIELKSGVLDGLDIQTGDRLLYDNLED